jgi:rSAM/selenodomain-associated transferase 1
LPLTVIVPIINETFWFSQKLKTSQLDEKIWSQIMTIQTTQLLIFSKYPTAGKAKTRLIPALGANNAAQLHRRMTEVATKTAQLWRHEDKVTSRQINLYYTSATETDFRDWLGNDLLYSKQSGNDLGKRMENAFATTFKNNARYAIGVGTDVPALSPALLQQAENSLADHDLILGPAADGGYYLIGLRTFQPELFTNIDWGTKHVLRQTLEIASKLELRVATLPQLNDIDRPEDLRLIKDDPRFSDIIGGASLLSVIIPTLNEDATLEKTLKNLQQGKNIEIIVADGGSRDETATIAIHQRAKLIEVSGGRAAQLNRGAAESHGR